ncbi:MAG: hypothetical protein K2O00_01695 [Muribaculaceae bacterium]|nr:hypothetical protein [Muribaculaceae bacterium]
MNKTILWLSSLLIAAMPFTAAAQSNIRSAFDAIIKCPEATITDSHSLDKNPQTNVKTGQSDIYNFVLPADKMKLVKNVLSAFEKDSEKAYSINKGKYNPRESEIALAVGDGSGSGVTINDEESTYEYALFLAPASEDPSGVYRYAYAISYNEKGGKIRGKLIVTYALTLSQRQKIGRERQYSLLRDLSNNTMVIDTTDASQQQSWFDTLMSYFQTMTQANSQTRIALATKAHKLILNVSKYPDVTEAEKNTVREILKSMISDSKYSESVLNELLNQCLVNLK